MQPFSTMDSHVVVILLDAEGKCSRVWIAAPVAQLHGGTVAELRSCVAGQGRGQVRLKVVLLRERR
jgi:hypothetical protein